MAYTDETLSKGIAVKKAHLTELTRAIQNLATSKKVTVDLSTLKYGTVLSSDIGAIQKAIHSLEAAFSENCCQANCCQTCQGCESCQNCQTCQKCQTCQSCQQYKCQSQCNCNCSNCDCGDDGA